jgi:ribosome-associated protein
LPSEELASQIAQLMLEKKTAQVVIMDMRPLTAIADFFIVGSVDTDNQARAVVDHIDRQMGKTGVKPWHVEGPAGATWILLDYVDVVVHLFRPEARAFYALEKLWGDAEISEIHDEKEPAK